MPITVSLLGTVELDAAVAKLGTSLESLKTAAIARAGASMRDTWKDVLLPHSHTFVYYGSIQSDVVSPDEAVVYTTAMRTVRKNAPAPYPRYVEFGTRFMAPRGYGRIAFQKGKDRAVDAAANVFRAGIVATFPR